MPMWHFSHILLLRYYSPRNVYWREQGHNGFNITSDRVQWKLTWRQKVVSPQIYIMYIIYMYTQVYTAILSLEYCPNILVSSLHFLDSSFLLLLLFFFYTRPYTERVVKPITFFRFGRLVICNGRAHGDDENENQICHVRRCLFWGEDRRSRSTIII